ncbi:hypothetical protein AUK22_01085 [bacterium CG2_30_54_10]|nr:MAG: hypothetical protein AUK22_01085 [bacterium CG2_30_54_10]
MGEGRATVATFSALSRLKLRVLFQSLMAWRSRWSLLLLFLMGVGLCLSIGFASVDFLAFVEGLFLGDPARWLMALGLIYLLMLVFTSDLIMGHTLNVGQLSTDHTFLTSLPIPPLALLGSKLFERLITDWPGVLLLLSGFLGISCRGSFSDPVKILLPILIFVQVELLLILTIILLSFFLQRVARPATINNFFSILGYMSAFMALSPHILIATQPREAFTWLIFNLGKFQGTAGLVLSPGRWIVDILLDGKIGRSFLHWEFFWLLAFMTGSGIFLAMCRMHWLTFVHPGLPMVSVKSKAWLSGMLRKETLLLKSDFNLLSNSLFMPITIIIFQILIFREQLTAFGLPHAMNMMGAAAMYFCLFGPINSIGSEGKAIFLLETLPISAASLIANKTLFWSLVAEVFFLPASCATAWYLGLPPPDWAALIVWLAILVPCLVWVGVSVSAIYPKFEGKVLQQRSTLEGKALGAMAMGMALPIKSLSAGSIAGGMIFALLALSVHGKAVEALEGRLDPERFKVRRFRAHDAFLAILVAMGIQSVIRSIFDATVPEVAATLLPWIISYTLGMTVLGYTTWRYARDRFPSAMEALGFRLRNRGDLVLALIGAAAITGVGKLYLEAINKAGFDVYGPSAEIWYTSCGLLGPDWSLGLLIFAVCLVAPLIEEAFFRGFADQAWRDLGWTGLGGIVCNGIFFAVLHPPVSMPLTFLLGIVCTLLFRVSRSLWPGILLHAVYNAGILYIHSTHI